MKDASKMKTSTRRAGWACAFAIALAVAPGCEEEPQTQVYNEPAAAEEGANLGATDQEFGQVYGVDREQVAQDQPPQTRQRTPQQQQQSQPQAQQQALPGSQPQTQGDQQNQQQAQQQAPQVVLGQVLNVREVTHAGERNLVATVRREIGRTIDVDLGPREGLGATADQLQQGAVILSSGQVQPVNGQPTLMAEQVAVVQPIQRRQTQPQSDQQSPQQQTQQPQPATQAPQNDSPAQQNQPNPQQ